MFGFFRSNTVVTHSKQIDPQYEFTPDGAEKLRETVAALWTGVLQKYDPKSYKMPEDWEDDMPAYMTGKSSGMKKEKAVAKIGKTKYTLVSNAKNFVFTVNPYKYIGAKQFMESLTRTSPGTVGTRDVAGRKSRMIMVVPLPYYIVELIMMIPVYEILINTKEYYFGEASGSAVSDNLRILTKMNGQNVFMAADVSQFDVSLRYDNMRLGVIEAFKNFFATRPEYNKALGPSWLYKGKELTLAELFIIALEKTKEAYYIMPSGEVKASKGLGSGEKGTAPYGTVANHAIVSIMVDEMRKAGIEVDIIDQSYLGDDSSMVMLVNDWSEKTLNTITDILAKKPGELGMDLNRAKTDVALFGTEYLKVPVMYGRVCPRITNLQTWSAENPSGAYSVIERALSLKSQLQTWIARGGDFDISRQAFTLAYLIMGRIKRGADYSGKDHKRFSNRGFFDLPAASMYVPISLGGIGVLWRGFEMASCDVFVGTYPEKILAQIMKCSTGLEKEVSLAPIIARELVRQNTMLGEEYRRNHRDYSFVKSVNNAIRYLTTNNVEIPRKNFFTIPADTVESTIAGQKAVRRVAEAENEERIRVCQGPLNTKKWRTILEPWSEIVFEDTGDQISEKWSDFPLVGISVFNRYKHMFIRGSRGPKSERIEAFVRQCAAKAAIDVSFTAKYIIKLVAESETEDIAMAKLYTLGSNVRKQTYLSQLVDYIWEMKDDLEFMYMTGKFSINDPILGEFRLCVDDLDDFIVWDVPPLKFTRNKTLR
jgi:hypothetical protein